VAADLGPPRRRSGPAPHELIPLIPESIAATLAGRADLLLRIVLELTSADPNTVAARHPALGRGTGSRPSSQN
jgi:hypothetical protein